MPLTKGSIEVNIDLTDIENDIDDLQLLTAEQTTTINSLISDVSDISEDIESLSSNGFVPPTTIKTVAESGDFFIGIDGNGLLYKISKADLLAGLSSGNGTPPTIKTQLLLHGESSIVDASSFARSLTLVGNPTISTSAFKFGSSSIYLNGSSSIETPNTGDLIVGSRDFCVETFVRLESYPTEYGVIVNSFVTGNQRWTFYLGNNKPGESGLVFTNGTNLITQSSSTALLSSLGWNLNTTYYVAMKRENGTVSLWREGIKLVEGVDTTNFTHVGITRIGAYTSQFPFALNGWIDELRITCPGIRNISSIPTSAFVSD